jgi:hypothetical protein
VAGASGQRARFASRIPSDPDTTVSVDDRLNFLHEKPVDFLGKAIEHT